MKGVARCDEHAENFHVNLQLLCFFIELYTEFQLLLFSCLVITSLFTPNTLIDVYSRKALKTHCKLPVQRQTADGHKLTIGYKRGVLLLLIKIPICNNLLVPT